MQKYAVVEKRVGETPLQALEAFRQTQSELAGIPLTYAGRLDPMASGKLVILSGEECKNRPAYNGLDKEYEFEVLLDCASDTGDVLGLARMCDATERYTSKKFVQAAKDLVGERVVPYPAFSSKTVAGVALFTHALAGMPSTIEIPTTRMRVYRLKYEGMRTIRAAALLEKILDKIVLLQADGFRTEEIGQRWDALLRGSDTHYTIAQFRAVVGSGTYIRTLASMIAQCVGTEGLAYAIHRSRIGAYQPLFHGLGFWKKKL